MRSRATRAALAPPTLNRYDSRSRAAETAVPLAPPLIESALPGVSRASGRARCAISTSVGDDAAHRRHRSHLGLRLRARLRHSRQGPGADAAVGVLVRPHRRHRPQPRASAPMSTPSPPRCAAHRRPAARPRDAGAQDHAAAGRVRRARLPVGLGLEGLRRHRRGLRHRAAGRPARIGPPAGADLHAGHQGRFGARPQHQRGRGRRGRRRRPAAAAARPLTHGALRGRASRTPTRAASSSPTPSSSSASPTTASCCSSTRR